MRTTDSSGTAVSEVVGEMLMIGIVLILVAVFSASLSNYLPSERSPTVTILMSNDTAGNITLWHKGGDWVKTDALKVIITDANGMTNVSTMRSTPPFIPVPGTQAFDLDGNITIIRSHPLIGDEQVVLATDRAVIFSGRIGRGLP
ncbi:type IV pilin N-terminal domain-containing protein [Methanoregula sp.]|uniref:type IV pilin N-terminal domain-containing protein n=1 Tax=Methanoregula sp. TaxID=2052170 RepID=UPI003564B0AB